MQDTTMAQVAMDHDHNHHVSGNGFGGADGWVVMNNGYTSSSHQPSSYESRGYGFMPSNQTHSLPSTTESFASRMGPLPTHHAQHQQLLPLIVPTHPTWPSMLTNPANYRTLSAPPVAIPPMSLATRPPKLHAIHATPSPRKTLTDDDRRRMCQYHEDNPSIKQTEIGAMFGVERSTVSKVLRQKEKYLYPDSGSLSPVKRVKGKFPDIERALSNWVRNTHKQGIPLTDAAIKEKAKYFAATVGNNEGHLKTNSTTWLEKFKQKNGIASGKLARKASDTNMSDNGSGNADSNGPSATQTPISPSSPCLLPSPLSAGRSDEDNRPDDLNNYFDFNHGASESRHSNSQSTASLSSVMTDTAPSSFSGGPSSPMTPFAFSPDGSSTNPWMAHQQARLPPPSNIFSRPRSSTFPTLGIDPSILDNSDNMMSKYADVSVAEITSPLESPVHEVTSSYSLDAAISLPPLNQSASNGSMGHQSNGNNLRSTICPSQDDVSRALDTLLHFFQQAPSGLVGQNEYMTVIKLVEKLRSPMMEPLPGGLHRINEQECEGSAIKIEPQTMALSN